MDTPTKPDIEKLLACVEHVAAAMKLPVVPVAATRAFLETLLFKPQAEGGRELWPCLLDGLITEIETRNGVMARCATWLSNTSGVPEAEHDVWDSEALEERLDDALFGRPAHVTTWDLEELNRSVALAFLLWFGGQESRFDPVRQLAPDVTADLMWAGPIVGSEELVKMVDIAGKYEHLEVLRQVTDDATSVLMYELVDEVTGLKHREAMAVRVDGGVVVDVMRVAGQGRAPASLLGEPAER